MIANNIFRWIGSLFTDLLFVPFNVLRKNIATADFGWWVSNVINWGFLFILLLLLNVSSEIVLVFLVNFNKKEQKTGLNFISWEVKTN